MSFRPSVTAFLSDIRPVAPLVFGCWSGTVADLWQVEVGDRGFGEYTAPDPRFIVVLGGSDSPLRLRFGGRQAAEPVRAAFIPADVPVRASFARGGGLTHLDLHFNAALLQRILRRAGYDAGALLQAPLCLASAPEVEGIAALLAQEVRADRGTDMVRAALASALVGKLFASAVRAPVRGGLSPAQLAAIDDLMRRALQRRLTVAEMAGTVGLSESRFAHAFRESRGVSPYRSLQALRVEAAKTLLAREGESIADVAAAAGFADQAHLTRAFRSVVGETPGAWRRARFSAS